MILNLANCNPLRSALIWNRDLPRDHNKLGCFSSSFTSFWIFLTSASRKVDDTLIGKFLFKIPNSFFSWFQICRKIYRSAYSPTSSKRARSHVRGVPVCGLGEPVTSKACTHCAEFHFFWYPLTGKTMKTPQMLLPKNWWNSVMGLVNLHLKEVYWTSTWKKLSKSIQRADLAKLEWKSVDVPSGTNHLHGFPEKSLFWLIILGFETKKNGMLWAPLPGCDGFSPAICINQPSCQGLQRQRGKAWHFPWRYWINSSKACNFSSPAACNTYQSSAESTAWCVFKTHTQFRKKINSGQGNHAEVSFFLTSFFPKNKNLEMFWSHSFFFTTNLQLPSNQRMESRRVAEASCWPSALKTWKFAAGQSSGVKKTWVSLFSELFFG